MKQTWLRVGYWNIHGLIDGETKELKTEYKDVYNVINVHDIFCLSEEQCTEKDIPNIHGYSCFKLCRNASKRINRYFGGLVVYYKQDLREGIRFVKYDTDFVWMKLCK